MPNEVSTLPDILATIGVIIVGYFTFRNQQRKDELVRENRVDQKLENFYSSMERKCSELETKYDVLLTQHRKLQNDYNSAMYRISELERSTK